MSFYYGDLLIAAAWIIEWCKFNFRVSQIYNIKKFIINTLLDLSTTKLIVVGLFCNRVSIYHNLKKKNRDT